MRIRQITQQTNLSSIPAVFRDTKPTERSETYQLVKTTDIVSAAERAGWTFHRGQSARRGKSVDTGAHLLVFRNEALRIPDLGPATSIPELVIVNSHDGSAAVRIALGLFRIACLNGLLSGLSVKQFRACHSVNGVAKLSDGIEYVMSNVDAELRRVEELSRVMLTEPQRIAFIQTCLNRRLESVRGEVGHVRGYAPRRTADLGGDAYTVLNRGQELLLRGGFSYTVTRKKLVDGAETITRYNATARPIYSVAQSLALNKFAVDTMNELLVLGGNL